jgi:molybdenum cofactor cytidylyltransferase
MWFARRCFDELRALHGDKAVWRLLESGALAVHEHRLPGRDAPPDVDTWDDYRALCRAMAQEQSA